MFTPLFVLLSFLYTYILIIEEEEEEEEGNRYFHTVVINK